MKTIFRGLLVLMIVAALYLQAASQDLFKAGLAEVVITPEKNIWMAGYAARNKPAEGKIHDLHAKALAIMDVSGNLVVLVTTDLLGLPRALTLEISEHAKKSYRLKREQILFNSSHTHTGPVLSGSLAGAYNLDSQQTAAVNQYTDQLKGKLIALIGKAIEDLSPASLSFGRGVAPFAMNRRQMTPNGMIIGVNPDGVVDRDVPVLRIESPKGTLRGVVFGYACHNTTLTGEFYLYSGDYSGFAQEAIEKSHPGVTSLFVAGCGADINPYPRSKLELAQEHGETLAKSVEEVLSGSTTLLNGQVKSVIGEVAIPFSSPPTKEELQARLNDKNAFRRRHAERMLQRLERDGKLISKYPHTIQIFRIGDLTLIGLAGEVVTDYSLRLKRELGGNVWVAGYSNDLCSYIPSAGMYKEGGYEVIDSMIYYDLPGPYKPEIEEKIISTVHKLASRLKSKSR
jgi:Neutral/alkaline non-lysosomal ceramidase, N-terminal